MQTTVSVSSPSLKSSSLIRRTWRVLAPAALAGLAVAAGLTQAAAATTIGSGNVGNGCGLELGWYLEHGDTVELEVEKIGILRNKVERQDA